MDEGLKALAAAFSEIAAAIGSFRRSWRYRVNVNQLSKGQERFDCTVEGTGFTRQEVLDESDALVGALRGKYPATD